MLAKAGSVTRVGEPLECDARLSRDHQPHLLWAWYRAYGIAWAAAISYPISRVFLPRTHSLRMRSRFTLALDLLASFAALPGMSAAQGDPASRVARLNFIEGSAPYQVSGDHLAPSQRKTRKTRKSKH